MPETRRKLLVVAVDHRRVRRFSEWALEPWRVDAVDDDRSALRALDDGVDVVVLSLDREDPTGERVLERIGTQGRACQVVAVTGDRSPPSTVDESVAPPVDRTAFRDCLRRVGERLAYDDRLREYYALAARRADLASRRSAEELADDREYERVTERAALRRRRADDLLGTETDYEDVFRGLFPGTGTPSH